MENQARERWKPGVLAAAFFILLACTCPPLSAQSPGLDYTGPQDYTTTWARIISLFGAVGAGGLIAYVLLFRRRQLATLQSKWMLFVGVCVLPVPVMVLSTAVGMEQAKAVSFCQSCHVMKTFVADMEDHGSNRLAAVHFKNRYIQRYHCYICHTDYGLFGTVEAKVSGLSHIWKETTGSYSLPIKVRQPYRFTICLDCHAGSVKFDRHKEHHAIVERTIRGEIGCTACHGSSHPPRNERGDQQ